MTLEFNPQIQNAPLDTVRDAIDSGSSVGSLQILDGSTLLATLPLSLPSFADATGGTSLSSPINSTTAVASGTPDAFRFVTSYGAVVFTGAVPDDLDLGAGTVAAGEVVSVAGYTLTEGTVQAREFASTVVFPYNTPPLDFDNPPVPSALVDPKDLKLDPLRGQDFESDGTTLRTAAYDGDDILLDGVPLVAVADVKALDLTFDGADNALVVYADSGDNVFGYDDSDQSITDLSVLGEDPRIHNDRQATESIVLSYRRGNDVFYRLRTSAVQPPLNWGPMEQGVGSGSGSQDILDFAHVAGTTWVAVLDSGYAARTQDAGTTWGPLVRGLNSGTLQQISAVAAGALGVCVSVHADGYAARSVDAGLSWSALLRGLGSGDLNPLWRSVATDGNGTWVAVGGFGYASRSTDNGATWVGLTRYLNSGATAGVLREVATDGNGTWVAVFDDGYASRSTDNGATWAGLTQGLGNAGGATLDINAVAHVGPLTWVAVFDDGYASRSTDNGATWADLPPRGLGMPSTQNILKVASSGDGIAVAVGVAGHASQTSTSGDSWVVGPRYLNSGAGTNAAGTALATDGAGTWMAAFTSGFCSKSPEL